MGRTHRLSVVAGILLLLAGIPSANAQSTLADKLRLALEQADEFDVDQLVAQNRLEILPFARHLLEQGTVAAVRDEDAELFQSSIRDAKRLGSAFESRYGERSISILADHYADWSPGQLAVKILADSLQASGTGKRTSRDTRDDAFKDYEEALRLYDSIDDEPGRATVLGGLGYVAYYADPEEALRFNTEALESRRLVDDRLQIGNALNTIALVYRVRIGDLESAVDYYRQAREIREEIGDYRGLGRTLAFLGDMLYRDFGQLEEGLENFLGAYDANMMVGDSTRAASALNVAGTLILDLGRYSESLEPLLRARSMRIDLGDLEGAAEVTNNLGIAYRRLGDFDAAISSYQEVVAMAREQENTELEAQALNNIAAVFIWAERPDRVISFADRARTAYLSVESDEGVLAATINIGSAYFELRDYASAAIEADKATVLADSLGDRINQLEALNLLANIETRTGEYEDAISNFKRALEIALDMSLPDHEFAATLGLGEVYERMGEWDTSISYYEGAFEILERMRREQTTGDDKSGFFKQQRYAFESYLHFLSGLHIAGQDGSPGRRAFEVAEQARARSFLDELSASISGVNAGISPALQTERDTLLTHITELRAGIQYESQFDDADRDAIAMWKADLSESESQFEDLERRIRLENPRYADLQFPEPVSIQDLQDQTVAEGTAILAYAVGDSSSTLWVVLHNDLALFVLPGRTELTAGVDAFRFALSEPTRATAADVATTGNALYQALIDPAEALLDGIDHLIIIPDDILSYVPFEALVEGTDEVTSFSDMPYLVRKAPISYAQSASVLSQIVLGRSDRTSTPNRDLLAFGDPIFSTGNQGELSSRVLGGSSVALEALPFSGEEVEAISSLFPSDRRDIFLQEDAIESTLKRQLSNESYRFLHIATHGLIDEENPDFSSIVLTASGDPNEDGSLLSAEIFNLSLDVDLVVLSACETGLGQLIRGEGMVGLTRAFMYAGSPSVAVSLWKVSDASTSELMQQFYGQMSEGVSKARALQSAKLTLLNSPETAHPFHWAPFVLVGDWK